MFDKIRKIIVLGGISFFIAILLIPTPSGLTPAGQKAFAVFILCLSLWISQAIPLSMTGLLGIALIPLFNILNLEHTFSLFGNRAIFFILGALILAAGIYQTGLGSRIAFKIMRTFGHNPKKLLLGILFSSAVLSCIMPEHAVAALLFPIIIEIASSLELEPLQSSYAKYLFLSMAWGAIAGGITTYLGGARNLLAVGLLEKNYDITIGFFEWITYSWPLPTLILLFASLMLSKFINIDVNSIQPARDKLKKKMLEKGDLSFTEKKLSIVLILVLFNWLFLSHHIDIAITSILGGISTFVIGVVEWDDIEKYVNWGILLMYGGAIVVATSLVETGATSWLSHTVFANLELAPFTFLIFLAIFTMVMTEGVSNVAAVAIVLPLAFSIGEIYNINPIIITLSVALPGGLAFSLPMGSPPNAIAFSSGYYRVDEAIKLGVILLLVAWISYIIVAKFYWPLIGLKIIL